MGLPIPGHFLHERESTRIGSTMRSLCSLLCSSGPLNVWNVKFHLAAMCTPSTFVGRGIAELWEALQKLRSWCHQRKGHRRQNNTSGTLCKWGFAKWGFYGAVRGREGEGIRFCLLCSVTECGYVLFAAKGSCPQAPESRGCGGGMEDQEGLLWYMTLSSPSLIWCTKYDPFARAPCFDYRLKAACVLKRPSK